MPKISMCEQTEEKTHIYVCKSIQNYYFINFENLHTIKKFYNAAPPLFE